MINIGDDEKTIYLTRGDATHSDFNIICFYFPYYDRVSEQELNYEFQLDDKISFVVHDKKGYTKDELLRIEHTLSEMGYTEPTEYPELTLTAEDTKVFDLLDKGKTYWYDIILNDTTTILGFDQDGGKQLIVYPEAVEE